MGYSPRGRKESDMTERLQFSSGILFKNLVNLLPHLKACLRVTCAFEVLSLT